MAVLIGSAALTILAWVGTGDRHLVLGWIDKAVGVALIALMAWEMASSWQ